jgi:hypothetical protein
MEWRGVACMQALEAGAEWKFSSARSEARGQMPDDAPGKVRRRGMPATNNSQTFLARPERQIRLSD